MAKKHYRSPLLFAEPETLSGGDDLPIDIAASEMAGYGDDVLKAWEAFLDDPDEQHDLDDSGKIDFADFSIWYQMNYGDDDDGSGIGVG